MGAIEEVILDEVNKSLESGMVERIIREKVIEAVEKGIEFAFSWGDTNKALRDKINEFLVPAIEKRDFKEFIPKLDSVLTDIMNTTALADNKKILANFRELMTEPEKDTVTVSELFAAYKIFVAKDVDTCGREVDTDERPTYTAIGVDFEVEQDVSRNWSSLEYLTLHFSVDEEDQMDALINAISAILEERAI